MGFPKNIKKTIPLREGRQLYQRREELLGFIEDKGTYLPKSILHSDLDRGMLDFVKENLLITTNGKTVNFIDIILSTQNWSQYTETWSFMNDDLNAEPPFVTVVRAPEMKYGSNPSTVYTIPQRREFFYKLVPTWDGQRKGADIYQIPQPVPIDINYSIKIMTNRIEDLNKFNRLILQKFSSRQAYATIKGHYIPIVMNSINDESSISVDSRKYFLQGYDFTMLGFLLDEEEFKVKPALSRVVQVYEVDTNIVKSVEKPIEFVEAPKLEIDIDSNSTYYEETIRFLGTLKYVSSTNVESFDVYVNGDYYGSNIKNIGVNSSDILRIDIIKGYNDVSKLIFEIIFNSK